MKYDSERYVTEGRIKHRLFLGFGISLLLMVVLGIEGLSGMMAIQSRLKTIVENQNVKADLVNDMRTAARERTITLYQMVTLQDPFEIDAQFMLYNQHAARFAGARRTLLTMDLLAEEREVLAEQAVLTAAAAVLQDQVVDLALSGEAAQASQLLRDQTVPAQNRTFAKLEYLRDLQHQAAQQTEADATRQYEQTWQRMLALVVIALVIGVMVAIFVARHYSKARDKLYREKQRAHVTLQSIDEGVITTDKLGNVVFLNPVAVDLTGWSEEEAKGRHLSEVLCLQDEEKNPLQENIAEEVMQKARIHCFAEHHHLVNRDGSEYAVEITASPLQDKDDSITGIVISFRNVTALREMARQMVYQATHDTLTGLVNRHEFERRLKSAINSARFRHHLHVLCYLDLDQFKIVNDTCGHMIGDELLRQLAQLLRGKVRSSDTLSRLGGDEFGLLLHDCNLEGGRHTAESLLESIRDFRFIWHDKSFKVGASIGLVQITANCGSFSDVLSAADSACYVAKDFGRNRVHVYQDDDEALNQRHGEMQWTHRIRDALENNKFQLYFQRIISLQDNRPVSRELLLRLQGDDGSVIPPMAFLPAAERYGIMPLIDQWVIKNALHCLADECCWEEGELHWTINLSGQSLCDEHFLEFVMQQIRASGVQAERICFEITETAAVSNLTCASMVIKTLKALGCKFALDDFGSGLSSFTYLKNLPVDYLKIDGSFVKNLASDPVCSAMVESINQIGHTMGLETIAEFAEDKETLVWLAAINVDYAQGFALHKPEPLTVVETARLPVLARA